MTALRYYTPLWLGTLVALALFSNSYPQLSHEPLWWRLLLVLGGCPLVGVICQLCLIGAQGAWAQVLPVPVGRSIRGRGAVVAGSLLLATLALGLIGAYLWGEELRMAAMILMLSGAAALVGATLTYIWHLPAAQPDFRDAR